MKSQKSSATKAGEVIKTEHEEQREFVQFFRRSYPGVRIYAIPNGGARGMASASRLKVEGVSPGVPDLHIPAWNVWIEMKRVKKGVVSDAQTGWHEYLKGIGHHVIVAYGCDQAKEEVKKWIENHSLSQ